jgi:Putative peptidoglycan binding domain
MSSPAYPGHILHRGCIGAPVEQLQRQLHDAYHNPRLAIDGDFGPATERVVIAFQAHRNLMVDGQVGPSTWARIFKEPIPRPPHAALAAAALAQAQKLLAEHVHEQGANNRGPIVDQIIRYADGQLGEPWCVDTVIWCYGHAGSKIVKPGFTREVSQMLQAGLVRTTTPQPGDICRFIFDHTAILVEDLGSVIGSIDGNTGAGNHSDGTDDGVALKYRPRSLVSDFLHVTR